MLIYGRNTVTQALNSKFVVTSITLEENIFKDEKISGILNTAKKANVRIDFVSKSRLSSLVKSHEHQGVIADVQFKETKLNEIDFNQNKKSFIYISEASFEHNIGAIIRTAECLGMGGVILPKNIDITATIAKISTGAVFFIPIIKIPIFQAIKSFREKGFFIYGIERVGKKYFEYDLSLNNLYIIGGEDKSLTDNVRSRCDGILEIPQFGETNSLNMSVAAGIIIGEDLRQKLS